VPCVGGSNPSRPALPLHQSVTTVAGLSFYRVEDRGKVFDELVEKMGGRLLAMYYCMGEYGGLVIYEAPDEATALVTVLSAVSPGDTSRRPCS
jgi:uncharacterized protein with GYD domain